jgi:hypothetical protein
LVPGSRACRAPRCAAQRVVVQRVDLFARGRADVALLGPRVFVVDALLDLGQQAQQLAAALLLVALLRCAGARCGSGGGSSASLAADLRQQLLLLLLQLVDAAARFFGASPSSMVGATGSGDCARPLGGLAAAGQVGLRDGLRLGGGSSLRALTRITSSGVSGRRG